MQPPTPTTRRHTHRTGPLGWLGAIFHFHGHDHDEETLTASDPALATQEGIRVVWLALAALGVTSLVQIVIVAASGSVALLADAVHNIGDFLNSIPLLVAFSLARRAATRRFTYGFGKAEDVAGVFIVLSIAFSAGYALWASAQKLFDPQPIRQIPWVVAAAFVGFLGNEAVALLQIRTGRRMGSEAMIADGLHARVDGLGSLAVLIAAAGSALGYPIVDPIVGLLIGVAIVFITKDAATRVWYRLMDAVDPTVTDSIERYASEVLGVREVRSVRARWNGHELQAEVGVTLDDGESDPASVMSTIRQALRAHVPHLTRAVVEIVPPTFAEASAAQSSAARAILPSRYQNPETPVSAAPMGAAALEYNAGGEVAWDEMWMGYCELALAGGPPHRGTLLEPVSPESIATKPDEYEAVVCEMERGLTLVTGLLTQRSETPGWVGLVCESEAMALWLLRAIVVENVTVRREDTVLWFPAGPDFRLPYEIKNVITVVAKTAHYWAEHAQAA